VSFRFHCGLFKILKTLFTRKHCSPPTLFIAVRITDAEVFIVVGTVQLCDTVHICHYSEFFFWEKKIFFSPVCNMWFWSFFWSIKIWMTSIDMSKEGLIQPLSQDEINKVRSFLNELDKPTCTSLWYSDTSISPVPLSKSQLPVGFNVLDKPSN